MTEGFKVAAGIVVAAVLLAVVYVGYHEFDRARDLREANEALNGLSERSAQAVAAAQQQRGQLEQTSAETRVRVQEADMHARYLSDDMRCVGGVVVRVSGSTYTQLGTVGYPVRCTGRMADRPIR